MKQLETTLFAVLQVIVMPICEAVLILSLMACDEKSPEAVVPSPKPETDESSSEGKEVTPSFSGEDSICNDYQLTGLPVCYITTDSGAAVTSRTEYIPAVMRIVHNGKTLFEDSLLRIRGRGHASWTDSPKQPYRLKLSHKASFLGMAANKHFVLLSNYFDKSLMRAAIGFKVGQLLECDWTPQSRFVELVLNGIHQGCYQLTESVRAGEDRIRVGDTGFIAEYIYPDRVAEEQVFFQTVDCGYFFKFKYPDEKDITADVLSYAAREMNQFEGSLKNAVKPLEYADHIDIESWAKWYYQVQLMMLEEYNMYMTKYDNTPASRLAIGPLWDFDWSLGSGYYDGEQRPNPNHHLVSTHYFRRLAADSLFMAEVTKLHQHYGRKVRAGVLAYYDELSQQLQKSQELNFRLWPILDKRISVGAFPLGSWEQEVECDRQFFLDHYEFLDSVL